MTEGQMERAWGNSVGWLKMVANIVAPFLLIASTSYGVAVAVTGVMSNEISDLMRKMTGQQASEQALEQLSVKVDRLASTVEAIDTNIENVDLPGLAEMVIRLEELAAMNHPIKAVNVDVYRSGVYDENGIQGQCSVEGPCEARFLVQRTVFGLPCGTPIVVSRTILDKDRVVRSAYPADPTATPTAVLGDWEPRSVFFRPFGAPEGPAEFNLVLEYPCGERKVRQALDPLPFTLIEEN